MKTIANLCGSPLQEADNGGTGYSLLVTDNPTNANNDREINYLDPNNMKLGTSENNISINVSDNSITLQPSSDGTINLGTRGDASASLQNEVYINSKNLIVGGGSYGSSPQPCSTQFTGELSSIGGSVSLSSGGTSLFVSSLELPRVNQSSDHVTTSLTGRNDILIKTNDTSTGNDKITLQASKINLNGQLLNFYLIAATTTGPSGEDFIPDKIEVLNNSYSLYSGSTLLTSGGISNVQGYLPSGNANYRILNSMNLKGLSQQVLYYLLVTLSN